MHAMSSKLITRTIALQPRLFPGILPLRRTGLGMTDAVRGIRSHVQSDLVAQLFSDPNLLLLLPLHHPDRQRSRPVPRPRAPPPAPTPSPYPESLDPFSPLPSHPPLAPLDPPPPARLPAVDPPNATLPSTSLSRPVLAHPSLIVTRQLEMINVLLGYEQANKYAIKDAVGNDVGFIAEEETSFSGVIARQVLRTRRPFKAVVLDREGRVVLK
ncbi:Scramblase-domain-containing protein, partial [Blyttiomyces helicus]